MPTIDFYDLIETAVVTLVRSELSSYFTEPTKQVTKSDDTYLDQGYDHFLIAYPGAFPTTGYATQIQAVEWEVVLDMLIRFDGTEPEAWARFKALRADVFYLFNVRRIGRTLNGTARVERVSLGSEERPRYIPHEASNPDSGIAFIAQAMALTVFEKVNRVD